MKLWALKYSSVKYWQIKHANKKGGVLIADIVCITACGRPEAAP